MSTSSKLKVGILGSGKIGTDLLIKIMRSRTLQCDLFVGRNLTSPGMKMARSMGVNISAKSLQAFKDHPGDLDLVFDATSAEYHREHARWFREQGIKVIDMTPAKVGVFCVPTIDADVALEAENINMVTCGGQASIPIIHVLASVFSGVSEVKVISQLASDSVGPGTLANLSEYYSATADAIRAYSGIANVEVALEVEDSEWKPDMLTILRARTNDSDLSKLYQPLQQRLEEVRRHVPGYAVVGTPRYIDGTIEVMISVRGQGDWIPAYAGNLDIINCAAIAVAEEYAAVRGVRPQALPTGRRYADKVPFAGVFGLLGNRPAV